MKRTIAIIVAVFALAVFSPSPGLPYGKLHRSGCRRNDGSERVPFNTNVSGMTIGATLGSDGMVYLSIQAEHRRVGGARGGRPRDERLPPLHRLRHWNEAELLRAVGSWAFTWRPAGSRRF